MRSLSPASWLAAIITMMLASSVAFGQSGYHLLPSEVKLGPWTFNPIYLEEADGTSSVESLLALADANALVGENIVAVWYNRQPDGTWEAKAWGGVDVGTAVSYVSQSLEISAEEKSLWSVPGLESDIDNIVPPEDYSSGILLSDPLAPVVLYSPDRDVVVEYLTSIGYKTANIPVDQSHICTSDVRLDAVASAMNETLHGTSATSTDRATDTFSSGCAAMSGSLVIVDPIVPLTPYTQPTYACKQTFSPFIGVWDICHAWTKARQVQETRHIVCSSAGPPKQFVRCDQSRLGTETSELTCCNTYSNEEVLPPCPPTTIPAEPSGPNATCMASAGTPFSPAPSTSYHWNNWAPSCSCVVEN